MTTAPRRTASGFTLIEVMVALLIFAVISVSTYRQVAISAKMAERIEQRYLALWLAESALDDIFIKREVSMTGDVRSEHTIRGQTWLVVAHYSEGPVKRLKKIDVSVYPDGRESDSPVYTLTRYLSED